MAPLTELSSNSAPLEWTDEHQKAFEEIKRAFCKEVLLAYPNFNQPFDIHADASDYQLGSVISQNGRPIAFYSRKLSPAQQNHAVAEKELLSIVETFKEFRAILLGQQLNVHTDHLNLLCKAHANQRVIRWRLLIEEHGPNLIHLPGKKNAVADALSRLEKTVTEEPIVDTSAHVKDAPDSHHVQCFATYLCDAPKETLKHTTDECSDKCVAECCADDPAEAEADCCPLEHPLIEEHQQKDKALSKRNSSSPQPFVVGARSPILQLIWSQPNKSRLSCQNLCNHDSSNGTTVSFCVQAWITLK